MDIVDVPAVDPVQGRSDRTCPGGNKQLIVTMPLFGGGVQVLYQNLLLVRIDDGNLVPGMYVDVKFIAERLRRSGDKRILPVNQTGDVVGNASGRERRMGTALEDRYISLRLQPANLGCGAHTRRIATYDDEHFSSFFHDLHSRSKGNRDGGRPLLRSEKNGAPAAAQNFVHASPVTHKRSCAAAAPGCLHKGTVRQGAHFPEFMIDNRKFV